MDKHKLFYLGIKGLVRDTAGKFLLVRKNPKELKDTDVENGKKLVFWDLPGGRVLKGEKPEETLRRELEEEMGLRRCRIQGLVAATVVDIDNKINGNGLVLFVYKVKTEEGFVVRLSSEDAEYEWVTKEEALKKLSVNYPEDFLRKLV